MYCYYYDYDALVNSAMGQRSAELHSVVMSVEFVVSQSLKSVKDLAHIVHTHTHTHARTHARTHAHTYTHGGYSSLH